MSADHFCARLCVLLACSSARCWAAEPLPDPAALVSGIESQYFDASVRPQDNFYLYVNGKWLETTDIPAGMGAYGTGPKLYADAQTQLRALIEAAVGAPGATSGTDGAKIADLYSSFMDEAAVEHAGTGALTAEFARINAVERKQDIPALIAHLQQIGVTVPYSQGVHLDPADATHYAFMIAQDGLGLPDRDYYLKDDNTTLRLMRRQYQEYIAAGLKQLGDSNAEQLAAQIVTLETALARAQWSQADSRDKKKTRNRIEVGALSRMAPGYDWSSYLAAAGVSGKVRYLIVAQPSYLQGFAQLVEQTPLAVWRAYFRWHLLSDYSPYLPRALSDAHFAFYGSTLQGIEQDVPRWRRGVELVDQFIGQGLGQLYVAANFPPSAKLRAEALVDHLLHAFRDDIGTLDWMGADTRRQAIAKLDKMAIKIGYPAHWRDYSALSLRRDDLAGNVMRAYSFEAHRSIELLGKPVDRSDWDSTPQSVNAFYNPERNEIVFPAAILQAPFFNEAADDAVNYGAIGMVIGHEISHAFDDQGSHYDGDGNLRDWWTPDDHARFEARTRPLIAEYNAFVPIPRHHLDGERTLDENIADNAGLAIAYKAYRLSLDGKPAPVIDALSGDQRFFIGFAQAWREKVRDSYAVQLLQSDPHAPSADRVLGTLINQSAFDETFNVKPGDHMYLPPDERVSVW
ncbi:MAG TPA: M13 family metallopeptidase [Steroidobacteraceae bacterium]